MATMLSFVATDAALPAAVVQAMLSSGTTHSFNAITVDSDTSTSDMVLLFATGKAGNQTVTNADDTRLAAFREALNDLLLELALMVVRDGEGATKQIDHPLHCRRGLQKFRYRQSSMISRAIAVTAACCSPESLPFPGLKVKS